MNNKIKTNKTTSVAKTLKPKKSMVQKTTSDEFIESLSPRELKKFKEGYKDFALSELLLAIMEQDEISVRALAKIAGVSPTVVQAMRSGTKNDFSLQSFFKILKGLGCKKLVVEIHGNYVPLDITHKSFASGIKSVK